MPMYPMDDSGDIAELVKAFTMTTPQCIGATVNAVRHVVRNGVPGDIVECGVWLGGSSMAMALALMETSPGQFLTMRPVSVEELDRIRLYWLSAYTGSRAAHPSVFSAGISPSTAPVRRLWLFDTFEGMTRPAPVDGEEANRRYEKDWLRIGLELVQANMALTGYPGEYITYVKGPVETTLPTSGPEQIAVLRLDTDWHASTKAELDNLWPRVSPGGVMILDDYACWPGCAQAVDEYFAGQTINSFPVGAFGIAVIKD